MKRWRFRFRSSRSFSISKPSPLTVHQTGAIPARTPPGAARSSARAAVVSQDGRGGARVTGGQRDFIICLEDGKKLKMLKRHLASRYDMTPEDYRHR